MSKHRVKLIFRKIFSNLWLKIGALVVAITIWFSISSQGRADRTITNIPYDIRNIPLNMEITDRGVGVVQILVRGPQSLVSSIQPENVSIPLTLPDDTSEGDIKLELLADNVITPYPNQLTILQISPSHTVVHLEKTMEKMVRVHPLVKGAPADGFELGDTEVVPAFAQIKGPESIVNTVTQIPTESIDISSMNLTFNERVNLTPQEKMIRVINPNRVTVRVEIKEKIIERSFPEFEIEVRKSPDQGNITVNPPVTTLTIMGPKNTLTNIQPKDLEVVIDCNDLPPGAHEVPINFDTYPDDINQFFIDPSTAEVIIAENPKNTQTSIVTPIASSKNNDE